ncbi:hypothetical protein GGR51DRAFT_559594 [Nemania sp. FL0031]|nr:hypothetical protein GGR51DRAFT_559594 [Nemania sp. FL0031]
MSNRDAVLWTAELLEQILLHLDMRTLLTAAQLVRRQWRDLITTSPTLQQALYFKPVAQASGPRTPNPLLAEVFPPWFRLDLDQRSPLVCRDNFRELRIGRTWLRRAFMHPAATWRRMLVQQPPVLQLGR